MKKAILLFIFLLSIQIVFTQNIGIDTMLQKLVVEKDANKRIDIIYHSLVMIGETDPLLGLKYAQRLLIYAGKNHDKIAEAYSTSYSAKMYGIIGNVEKGLEYGLKGKALAEKTGNGKLIALANALTGNIYKSLADYPKAISLYMATATAAEKANYPIAITWGYQNLADCYLASNQIDSALKYAQKDYELCQQIKYFDFFNYTLINLGGIHGKLGNSSLALAYFDMAITESDKTKSPRQLNWALTAKAQYFFEKNQLDSCIVYAKKAIAAVQNNQFTSNSIKPAKLLLDNYRGKNVDSAFKYSELYRITNDSFLNAKAIQQIQLMTFEEDLRQQELAAEKIKANDERKQNIQFALIAFGIISFIIIFLLLSRSFITNTKMIEFLGVVALLIVFEFLNLLLLIPAVVNLLQMSLVVFAE
jgi:tetratricopeptide (TPR) repeat protein